MRKEEKRSRKRKRREKEKRREEKRGEERRRREEERGEERRREEKRRKEKRREEKRRASPPVPFPPLRPSPPSLRRRRGEKGETRPSPLHPTPRGRMVSAGVPCSLRPSPPWIRMGGIWSSASLSLDLTITKLLGAGSRVHASLPLSEPPAELEARVAQR